MWLDSEVWLDGYIGGPSATLARRNHISDIVVREGPLNAISCRSDSLATGSL